MFNTDVELTQQEKGKLHLFLVPVSLLLSYVVGLSGFNVFWFLVFFFIFWSLFDYNSNYDALHRQSVLRQWMSQKIVSSEKGESSHWLNVYVYHLWPHTNPFFSGLLRDLLKEKLEGKFYSDLLELKVAKVDFGKIPVQLYNITETQETKEIKDDAALKKFSVCADLAYNGEAVVEFDVAVGRGEYTYHIPLSLRNLVIHGKMRFDFSFTSRWPFIYGIDMAFKRKPEFDISLFAWGLDLISFPFVRDSVHPYMSDLISGFIVKPFKYTFSPTLWPPEGIPNEFWDEGLFDPYQTKPIVKEENRPNTKRRVSKSSLKLPRFEDKDTHETDKSGDNSLTNSISDFTDIFKQFDTDSKSSPKSLVASTSTEDLHVNNSHPEVLATRGRSRSSTSQEKQNTLEKFIDFVKPDFTDNPATKIRDALSIKPKSAKISTLPDNFLKSKRKLLLDIHVGEAKEIVSSNGDTECFVTIKVGTMVLSTPAVQINSKWDTNLEFPLSIDSGITQLLLECWGKSHPFQPDEFLGKCLVLFEPVITAAEKGETKTIEDWFILRGTLSGAIHLKISCECQTEELFE
eukprot:TRINITY_DN21416_c0_g1_i1.p1 TRINITY_DN21416_c0_g1~~TRINITY_DN21416_c0_g1_i1.p1  ORF type:complete len:573 (-),score=73.60 TRINITY_DN21416_c0_g1_i1:29-1747(-)